MLYSATHVTRHFYESPVSQCLNEFHLTPRQLPNQRVLGSSIRVQPEPTRVLYRKDYFGNDVATAAVFQPHDVFVVEASSVVEVIGQTSKTLPPLSWEEARDLVARPSDADCLQAFEFVFDSPLVSASEELANFARPIFLQHRPLLDALKELSQRIHSEFLYQPKSTSIAIPLIDVLRNRRGVCQDFAHVMIGTLRSLRLPARYVSGYLRSRASYQGAEASHAWVSAFIPGSGWLDFDPTNDVMPSDGHATMAWGRDYADVTPVKGITLGGCGQTVQVEVSLEPIEPSSPLEGVFQTTDLSS